MKFKKRKEPTTWGATTVEACPDAGWYCWSHGLTGFIGRSVFNSLPEHADMQDFKDLGDFISVHFGYPHWYVESLYEEVKPCPIRNGAWTCREDAGHDGNHKDSGVTWKEPEFKTYQLKTGERYENRGAHTHKGQVIFQNDVGGLWQSPLCSIRDLPIVIGAEDWDGVQKYAAKKTPWIPLWVVKRLYVECDGPATIEPTPDNYGRTWAELAKAEKAIELGKAYGACPNKLKEIAASVCLKPLLNCRCVLPAPDDLTPEKFAQVARKMNDIVWMHARDKERADVSNVAKAPEFKFHRGARITYSEES